MKQSICDASIQGLHRYVSGFHIWHVQCIVSNPAYQQTARQEVIMSDEHSSPLKSKSIRTITSPHLPFVWCMTCISIDFLDALWTENKQKKPWKCDDSSWKGSNLFFGGDLSDSLLKLFPKWNKIRNRIWTSSHLIYLIFGLCWIWIRNFDFSNKKENCAVS